jgi:hypothetical protein
MQNSLTQQRNFRPPEYQVRKGIPVAGEVTSHSAILFSKLYQMLDTAFDLLYHTLDTDIRLFRKEANIMLTNFPLGITTHPLFIVLAYVTQVFSLLIGIAMVFYTRKTSTAEGTKTQLEREANSPSFQKEQDKWRTRLRDFHAISSEDDDSIIYQTKLTWMLLQNPSSLIVSVITVTLAILNLLVFVFSQGAIFHQLPWLLVLSMLFPLSSVSQRANTYGISFRRVKRTMQARVSYADVNERHLSDYRSDLSSLLVNFVSSVSSRCPVSLSPLTRSSPSMPTICCAHWPSTLSTGAS